MGEIFENIENFKTLIDYTRELRDQMGWKSPDSWFSDNVDVVLKKSGPKFLPELGDMVAYFWEQFIPPICLVSLSSFVGPLIS